MIDKSMKKIIKVNSDDYNTLLENDIKAIEEFIHLSKFDKFFVIKGYESSLILELSNFNKDIECDITPLISKLRLIKGIDFRGVNADYSCLSQLTELESIKLEWCTIDGLDTISQIPNLKSFYMKTCKPKQRKNFDLSWLGNSINLEELEIDSIAIKNFNFAQSLVKLKTLKAAFVSGMANIASMKNLLELEKLELLQIRTKDIGSLAYLKNLSELTLYVFAKDLSPLAQLENLKTLCLWSCKADTVMPLSKLTKLTTLKIDECILPDYDIFSQCTSVESLKVSSSNVRNLDFVVNMTNLSSLTITYDNELNDLSGVSKLTNLHTINAEYSKIADISAVADLINLEELRLYKTQVYNLAPLSNLQKLEKCCAACTKVMDVSCLCNLPSLKELNVRGTNVTDISAFIKSGKADVVHISTKPPKRTIKTDKDIEKSILRIKKIILKKKLTVNPVLSLDEIKEFEKNNNINLPPEYVAFLTEVCNGWEPNDNVSYTLLPLSKYKFDKEAIQKKFPRTKAWCWEDSSSNISSSKIIEATTNGQIELMNIGCGITYNLALNGKTSGQIWCITDVGMYPHNDVDDFLDWIQEVLSNEIM